MEHKREFQNIYKNSHDKIRRYVARLIGENEAEDVAQEVFLKINAALDNFQGKSTLSTWIYRIATNAAIDHIRKAGLTPLEHIYGEDARCVPASFEDDMAVDRGAAAPDRQLILKEMSDCIRGIVKVCPKTTALC